ncbi:MmgE/PrpD family protein [Caballeronia cordobensis]|uniref:MmgE/PrpD family protein n=1 Tax=Caballeronia cordobensis TaxID=1353886 RepID=UPI00045F0330|nr:MmgE/PrpD family protein [Burkholderia sp. RPE67]
MGSVLNRDAAQSFAAYVEWAVQLEWRDVSPKARRRAAMVLTDDLTALFSALDEPQVAAARAAALAGHAHGGAATLFAPGAPRIDTLRAASLNALAMGWNELDEGFRKAVCHAGLYVLPALLARADERGASLEEVLRALVLGYETVTRVAQVWRFPALTIHPHALLAPLGAAAGVGFLMRLPAGQMIAALGSAATMAMVGPFDHAPRGVLARNTWAAQAALAGLTSTEWAVCGIGGVASSPADVLAGALGASEELAALDARDTATWAVESGYQKAHACCQYAHSTIEAVQALQAAHPSLRDAAAIERVEIEVHPLGLALDDTRPATTLGAKFSVPHAAAAAWVKGDGGVASFDSASLVDPSIARLREAVTLAPFPEARPFPHDRPSRVTAIARDGARYTQICWSASGGPDRPLPEEFTWARARRIAAPHAPGFVPVMEAVAAAASREGAPDDALKTSWSRYVAQIFTDTQAAG